MTLDPRDAIWNETYGLQYNASYTEEIEKALLTRWVWLDSITRIAVAVAISAGSAALAGLVFWKNSDYTFLWPLFTSASALLAIVSNQLNVVDKVKRHTSATAEMRSLAFDSGTLIVRMKINAQFPVADFEKKLLAFRNRYRVQIEKSEHDLLLTERLRTPTQSKLNRTKTIVPPRGNHESR